MDGLYRQCCSICVCVALRRSERFIIFYFWLPIRYFPSPKSVLYNSYRLLHHFCCFCTVPEHTLKDHLVAWSHFVSVNRKSFLNFPTAIASRTPRASKPPKCQFLNLELLFVPFALTVGYDRVSNSGFGVISELFFLFFECQSCSPLLNAKSNFPLLKWMHFSSHWFLVFY